MSTQAVPEATGSRAIPPPIPRKTEPPTSPQRVDIPPAAVMEPEPIPSWERMLATLGTSFGVSLLLHIAVLATLAFWVLRSPVLDELALDMVVAQGDKIAEVETPAVKLAPASDPKNDVSPQKTNAAIQAISSGPNRKIEVDLPIPDFSGVGSAAGNGDGRGIFGTGREGRSFVFVVDCSGSMIADGRFNRAISELHRTINALKSSQQFFVVFYSDFTLPLFTEESPNIAPRNTKIRRPPKIGNRLLRATAINKTNARDWILRVRPGGNTEPQEALEIALGLKPEVIYFLTDGEIPAVTAEVIRNANKGGVIVHAVALGYEGSADLLRRIAKENKGRYTFVK